MNSHEHSNKLSGSIKAMRTIQEQPCFMEMELSITYNIHIKKLPQRLYISSNKNRKIIKCIGNQMLFLEGAVYISYLWDHQSEP